MAGWDLVAHAEARAPVVTREKAHAALVAMLRDVLPDVAVEGVTVQPVRRVHAGKYQREQGAWSWWVTVGRHDIGAQQPLADVLKAYRDGRLSIYDQGADLTLYAEKHPLPVERRRRLAGYDSYR